MQTLPCEGHNVAYQCKGLYQSNTVFEYEVKYFVSAKIQHFQV